MQLKRFIIKAIITTAVLVSTLFWLACTNSGLNTVLTIATYFAPVRVTYETVHGSLWGRQIIIANVEILQDKAHLQLAEATINWRAGTFKLVKISGFEQFLPGQQFLRLSKETRINLVSGTVQKTAQGFDLTTKLHGTWQQARLEADLKASNSDGIWLFHKAHLSIGKNLVDLQTSDQQQISWVLQLTQPEIIFHDSHGAIHASGNLELTKQPRIAATINSKRFGLQQYQIRNLNAAVRASIDPSSQLQIAISADALSIDQHSIEKLQLQSTGTIQQHQFRSSCRYNGKALLISATGKLAQHVWQTNNLQISYDQQSLRGSADYNFAQHLANLKMQGNIYSFNTTISAHMQNLTNVDAKVALIANQQNHLHAELQLQNDKLAGNVEASADDLSLVMQLLPDVTRLKGHVRAQAKISGTLQQPEIKASAHVTEITATIPSLGIKIKPMELHVHNEGMQKLILKGSGKMRRGPGEFTISGYIEPFKANMPNQITLIGNNVEFINNTTAHLIANQQLIFKHDFAANQLNINGHIDVLRGNIYFDHKKTSTVKSKDVVFIDRQAQAKKDSLKVNPNLNIWIYEEVHFKGFGLDADISGNLDVSQRNDTLYGSGRVTIKKGTYELPGQKLSIHKGRLLYPVGTLLVNPSLDIKMLDSTPGSHLEILVRGNAQAPLIHESGIGKNTDKAMSQAMLAGSSVLSKNLLQEKLKLTELGFASSDNPHSEFASDHSSQSTRKYSATHDKNSFRNKDLVVGRRLSDKLYLQYLQSMDSEKNNKRGRLKYALSDIWSLDLEAGTQGAGADLSFVVERD